MPAYYERELELVLGMSLIFELELGLAFSTKRRTGAYQLGLSSGRVEPNNFEPSQTFLTSYVNKFFSTVQILE